MTKHRLHKLIAATGLCSRRKAEILIAQARVTVNNQIAQQGDQADPDIDLIKIDGRKILMSTHLRVFLLNKPVGVISTCNDPTGRSTVLDLLPCELREGLYPVGRLDINSRGALLLTNHGELTQRLTHPRYAHSKTYRVLVKGHTSKITIEKWRKGVIIDGKLTKQAKVEVIETLPDMTLLEIILKEGRNRQIRKVAKLLGHQVIDLERTAISNLKLNGLPEGHWRELAEREWSRIIGKD